MRRIRAKTKCRAKTRQVFQDLTGLFMARRGISDCLNPAGLLASVQAARARCSRAQKPYDETGDKEGDVGGFWRDMLDAV